MHSTKSRSSSGFGSKSRKPEPELSRQVTYQFDEDEESLSSSSSDDEIGATKTKDDQTTVNLDDIIKADKSRKKGQSGPYSKFSIGNDLFRTRGKVSARDGRLRISVKEVANSEYLAKTLNAGIKHGLLPVARKHDEEAAEKKAETASDADNIFEDASTRVKLNIVVIVIGSRGDIQPFLKIGQILKEDYGHRVRIASHPAFKDFVEKDAGLEFFSVGGDPSELMAFMVKNPGLIPKFETVKAGEIGKRRASMYEMFQGMWRACVDITTVGGAAAMPKPEEPSDKPPFIADVIIANPPSFAHVHIAERLGVPLHIMFTFPYTPTTQFPHALANVRQSNVDRAYSNFMSYPLVEMMTWQGLGDLVNKFRVRSLGLDPVSTLWAPGSMYRLAVPHTYLWSPSLVPKPRDWGPEIDLAGFVFLDLGSSFKPPKELMSFLNAGSPPVYIGFGSIVVDDPNKFTDLIFSAVKQAGVRALVSKGWGGIGGEGLDVPENIFLLDNTPHDWLFPRVSAVVHHGGAGTTAIGLKCARPTMIVPFFGDQPFWGSMVAKAHAGAFECIPYKKLTAEKLAKGIKECLTDEAKKNVQKIADNIAKEGDGALNAARSFHRSLPLRGANSMRCSFLPERVAVWQMKGTQQRFSALVAELLVKEGKIRWKDLMLCRPVEWNDFEGPGEPFTGAGMVAVRTVRDATKGLSSVPVRLAKVTKRRDQHEEKKRKRREKVEQLKTQMKGGIKQENLNVSDRRKVEEEEKNESGGKQSEGSSASDTGNDHHSSGTTPQSAGTPSSQDDSQTKSAGKPSNSLLEDGDNESDHQSQISTSCDEEPAATARHDTQLTAISADPDETLVGELAHQTGSGMKVSAKAILRAPLELQLAVAQGFHNAPRLYGDETVRRPRRITGIKSGLRAGRDEFAYGYSDAFTGLYKLPKLGLQHNGVVGCLEGFGMSIGGLVLKPISASAAPLPFALKGIEKEWSARHGGPGTNRWIREGRTIQGSQELLQVESEQKHRHERSETDAHDEPAKPEPRDNLKSLEARVDHGWKVLAELFAMKQEAKERSCLTQMRFLREKRKWRNLQVLESIETAERALNARKKGIPIEEAMLEQQAEMKRARMPRKPGMEPAENLEKHPDARPRDIGGREDGSTGDRQSSDSSKDLTSDARRASGTAEKDSPTHRTSKRTRHRNTTAANDFGFSAISGAVK